MQWTGSHHLHLRGANWTTERKKMNILGKGKCPGTHNNIELGFFQCPFFCFSVTEHMPEPQPQTAWACDSPDGNCHYSNRPGTLLQVSWSCTLCVKGRKQLALYKGQMWCFALKAPPPPLPHLCSSSLHRYWLWEAALNADLRPCGTTQIIQKNFKFLLN